MTALDDLHTQCDACVHGPNQHPDPGCPTYDRLLLAPVLTACDQFQPMDDDTPDRRPECDGQLTMEVGA